MLRPEPASSPLLAWLPGMGEGASREQKYRPLSSLLTLMAVQLRGLRGAWVHITCCAHL